MYVDDKSLLGVAASATRGDASSTSESMISNQESSSKAVGLH